MTAFSVYFRPFDVFFFLCGFTVMIMTLTDGDFVVVILYLPYFVMFYSALSRFSSLYLRYAFLFYAAFGGIF